MKKLLLILLFVPLISYGQQTTTTNIYDENGFLIGTETYDNLSGLLTRKDKDGLLIGTALRQKTPGMIVTYEQNGSSYIEYGSANKNSISTNSDGSFTVYDSQGNSKTYSDGIMISEIKANNTNLGLNNLSSSQNNISDNLKYEPISNISPKMKYRQDPDRKKLNKGIGKAQAVGTGVDYTAYSKALDKNLAQVKQESEELAAMIKAGQERAFYNAPRRKLPQKKVEKEIEINLSDYSTIVLEKNIERYGRGQLKDLLEPSFLVRKKMKKKYANLDNALYLSIFVNRDFEGLATYGFGNKTQKIILKDFKGKLIYSATHINNRLIDLILPISPKLNIASTPYKTEIYHSNGVNLYPLPESIEIMYNSKSFVDIGSNKEITVLLRSDIKATPQDSGSWYLIYSEEDNLSGWVHSSVLKGK